MSRVSHRRQHRGDITAPQITSDGSGPTPVKASRSRVAGSSARYGESGVGLELREVRAHQHVEPAPVVRLPRHQERRRTRSIVTYSRGSSATAGTLAVPRHEPGTNDSRCARPDLPKRTITPSTSPPRRRSHRSHLGSTGHDLQMIDANAARMYHARLERPRRQATSRASSSHGHPAAPSSVDRRTRICGVRSGRPPSPLVVLTAAIDESVEPFPDRDHEWESRSGCACGKLSTRIKHTRPDMCTTGGVLKAL